MRKEENVRRERRRGREGTEEKGKEETQKRERKRRRREREGTGEKEGAKKEGEKRKRRRKNNFSGTRHSISMPLKPWLKLHTWQLCVILVAREMRHYHNDH